MALMVTHASELMSQDAHSWQCPEFSPMALAARSGDKRLRNLLARLRVDLGFASGFAFASECGAATCFPPLLPAVTDLSHYAEPLVDSGTRIPLIKEFRSTKSAFLHLLVISI